MIGRGNAKIAPAHSISSVISNVSVEEEKSRANAKEDWQSFKEETEQQHKPNRPISGLIIQNEEKENGRSYPPSPFYSAHSPTESPSSDRYRPFLDGRHTALQPSPPFRDPLGSEVVFDKQKTESQQTSAGSNKRKNSAATSKDGSFFNIDEDERKGKEPRHVEDEKPCDSTSDTTNHASGWQGGSSSEDNQGANPLASQQQIILSPRRRLARNAAMLLKKSGRTVSKLVTRSRRIISNAAGITNEPASSKAASDNNKFGQEVKSVGVFRKLTSSTSAQTANGAGGDRGRRGARTQAWRLPSYYRLILPEAKPEQLNKITFAHLLLPLPSLLKVNNVRRKSGTVLYALWGTWAVLTCISLSSLDNAAVASLCGKISLLTGLFLCVERILSFNVMITIKLCYWFDVWLFVAENVLLAWALQNIYPTNRQYGGWSMMLVCIPLVFNDALPKAWHIQTVAAYAAGFAMHSFLLLILVLKLHPHDPGEDDGPSFHLFSSTDSWSYRSFAVNRLITTTLFCLRIMVASYRNPATFVILKSRLNYSMSNENVLPQDVDINILVEKIIRGEDIRFRNIRGSLSSLSEIPLMTPLQQLASGGGGMALGLAPSSGLGTTASEGGEQTQSHGAGALTSGRVGRTSIMMAAPLSTASPLTPIGRKQLRLSVASVDSNVVDPTLPYNPVSTTRIIKPDFTMELLDSRLTLAAYLFGQNGGLKFHKFIRRWKINYVGAFLWFTSLFFLFGSVTVSDRISQEILLGTSFVFCAVSYVPILLTFQQPLVSKLVRYFDVIFMIFQTLFFVIFSGLCIELPHLRFLFLSIVLMNSSFLCLADSAQLRTKSQTKYSQSVFVLIFIYVAYGLIADKIPLFHREVPTLSTGNAFIDDINLAQQAAYRLVNLMQFCVRDMVIFWRRPNTFTVIKARQSYGSHLIGSHIIDPYKVNSRGHKRGTMVEISSFGAGGPGSSDGSSVAMHRRHGSTVSMLSLSSAQNNRGSITAATPRAPFITTSDNALSGVSPHSTVQQQPPDSPGGAAHRQARAAAGNKRGSTISPSPRPVGGRASVIASLSSTTELE